MAEGCQFHINLYVPSFFVYSFYRLKFLSLVSSEQIVALEWVLLLFETSRVARSRVTNHLIPCKTVVQYLWDLWEFNINIFLPYTQR